MAAVESPARLLTLKDYLALPAGNGLEREIIRGRLFGSPRPRILHQYLLGELFELLSRYVGQRGGHSLQVILDADLLMDTLNTYLSPDLMYFPAEAVPTLLDLMARGHRIHLLDARPELVVEVLSPRSEERDLVEKRGGLRRGRHSPLLGLRPTGASVRGVCAGPRARRLCRALARTRSSAATALCRRAVARSRRSCRVYGQEACTRWLDLTRAARRWYK